MTTGKISGTGPRGQFCHGYCLGRRDVDYRNNLTDQFQ